MLRRLCTLYHALPSAVLAEDAGLLLQLVQVENLVDEAEDEVTRRRRAREQLEQMISGGR